MAYTHTQTAKIALNLGKRQQFPLVSQWAIQLANTIVMWNDRYKSRRPLRTMSYAQLADIGVTPKQAKFEARKPFWRA